MEQVDVVNIMIILAAICFHFIAASEANCCISWTKNNDVTDKYRHTAFIGNSSSTCTLRECMAACSAEVNCRSVGFDEGNCLCYVYDQFSTSKTVGFIQMSGWQHFDVHQGKITDPGDGALWKLHLACTWGISCITKEFGRLRVI